VFLKSSACSVVFRISIKKIAAMSPMVVTRGKTRSRTSEERSDDGDIIEIEMLPSPPAKMEFDLSSSRESNDISDVGDNNDVKATILHSRNGQKCEV